MSMPSAALDKQRRTCTVATWNLHGCIGLDFRFDPNRISRLSRQMMPDIMAFQEVDLRKKLQPGSDLKSLLMNEVGENVHEAWSIDGNDGNYGQLLVSRFPVARKLIHDISISHREPRKVMDVILEIKDQPVRVLATHLGFMPSENIMQINMLHDILLSENSLPQILMGDFNDMLSIQAKQGFSGLFDYETTSSTYPSFCPLVSLDRIMVRGKIKMISSSVLRRAFLASDHLPVSARIELQSA